MRHIHINYGYRIEQSIKLLQELISKQGNEKLTSKVAPRYIALKLLEQDEEELARISNCANADEIIRVAKEESEAIEKYRNEPVETVITDSKYGFIEGALKETLKPNEEKSKITRSRLIDNILTNKYLSYPVFLLAIWITFQATFILGDYPMQWIEQLVSWSGKMLTVSLPDNIYRDMLVDGILGGVGGVIVFLPNILILFQRFLT